MFIIMHNACLCYSRLCSCALDPKRSRQLRDLQLQYYQALKGVIEDSGRYDKKEDFTVVLQPFMADQRVPKDVSSECLPRLCCGGGVTLFLEMFSHVN